MTNHEDDIFENHEGVKKDSSVKNLIGLRAFLIPPMSKEDLLKTLSRIKEFPDKQKKLLETMQWKKSYDGAGFSWFGMRHKFTSSELAIKKDELLFALADTTSLQIDSLNLILQLTVMIGEQQSIIQKQQNDLKGQQELLESQQNQISFQQEELKCQQEQLGEQNKEIKSAQKKLADDNEKLIESAEILKSLRQLGEEHDNEIDQIKVDGDSTMSGLERAMAQVMLISKDLKIAMKQVHKLDCNFGEFRKQILQTIQDLEKNHHEQFIEFKQNTDRAIKVFEKEYDDRLLETNQRIDIVHDSHKKTQLSLGVLEENQNDQFVKINQKIEQTKELICQEGEQNILKFLNQIKASVENIQWNS